MKKTWIVGLSVLFLVGCSGEKQEETEASSSSVQSSQTTQQKKIEEKSSKSSSISSQMNEALPLDQHSDSAVANDSSESVTIDSSEVNESVDVNAVTPAPLRGTWMGNNDEVDIEFTITENTIISNGQTYAVTDFSQSGNTYTIYWDIDSVANPGNPQPFIYTYSPETDELSNSIVFHRK
ncbi:hypothetical protein JZO66_13650 [Enterococcus sp. DIV0242_7C1]|uniref:Uncharacterized protein n=1 Tax=Candidatus Enterococcus dunnyi TaxID=1834192 RepID=A0A200J7F3_9ENTE|nr:MULTISPECIES: hypothetical protein [unclassified Enterococcus]MBO0471596.1 hypothetical protein [Enterococcus sp. DIV0242_7C1]OUZ32759.1 hypothetical protein A5889_001468 [Enterococcus sp. 9D6_DIV0238]